MNLQTALPNAEASERAHSTSTPVVALVPEDVESTTTNQKKFPVGMDRDPHSTYSRRTFLLDSWGCVGFNGADPNFIPDDREVTRIPPRFLRVPHIHSNEIPYAPFVLRDPQYKNEEFLRRLKVSYGTIPHIETVDADKVVWYQLDPVVQRSWLRLQEATLYTIAIIRKYYDCYFNLSFCTPRLPDSYGFLGSYRSLAELKRKVLDSRDAFNLLFAYAQYFISGVPTTTLNASVDALSFVTDLEPAGRSSKKVEVPQVTLPTWARIAIDKHKIHPTWMHMILFSEMHDFTKKRVGCYIKVEDCEFLHAVPSMLKRNIPLVFMWPLEDPNFGKRAIASELSDRFAGLVQLTQDERHLFLSQWQGAISAVPSKHLKAPASLRDAREENSMTIPSKSFGVGSTAEQMQDDASIGVPYGEIEPANANDHVTPAEDTIPLVNIANVSTDIRDFGAWTDFITEGINPHNLQEALRVLDRATASAPVTRTLEIVLRDRFGFCPTHPPPLDYTPLTDSSADLTDRTFFKTRIILSDTKSRVPDDPQWRRDVHEFAMQVAGVYSSKGDISAKLGGLCDLVRCHANHTWKARSNVVVRPIRFRFVESDVPVTLFEIFIADEEAQKWRLFVRDATTAAECMRASYTSTREIAELLLERASPFSTCTSNRASPEKDVDAESQPYDVPTLGWRSFGYKPDVGDFCVYETLLRQFLRLRRARAVWKLGGLYWRIACYLSDRKDWLENVLDGPSVDPGASTVEFQVVDGDHNTLIDDGLSADEVNLLIGRYKVYTGMGKQYSDSSWWPHPRVFEGSFLDIGYWAPACETWFQNRLSRIQNGKYDLKTSSEWRLALHQQKDIGHFVKGHMKISSSYVIADSETAVLS